MEDEDRSQFRAVPVLRADMGNDRSPPNEDYPRPERNSLGDQISEIAWKELTTSSGPASVKKHS